MYMYVPVFLYQVCTDHAAMPKDQVCANQLCFDQMCICILGYVYTCHLCSSQVCFDQVNIELVFFDQVYVLLSSL